MTASHMINGTYTVAINIHMHTLHTLGFHAISNYPGTRATHIITTLKYTKVTYIMNYDIQVTKVKSTEHNTLQNTAGTPRANSTAGHKHSSKHSPTYYKMKNSGRLAAKLILQNDCATCTPFHDCGSCHSIAYIYQVHSRISSRKCR